MCFRRKLLHLLERSSGTFRAINRDGYLVDLIKPLSNPAWKKSRERIGKGDDELVAAEIAGLAWLENALLSKQSRSTKEAARYGSLFPTLGVLRLTNSGSRNELTANPSGSAVTWPKPRRLQNSRRTILSISRMNQVSFGFCPGRFSRTRVVCSRFERAATSGGRLRCS